MASPDLRLPEGLHQQLEALVPRIKERLQRIKREHGSSPLPPYTVHDALAGSRGIKCILWETSHLHPDHGILYRGLSIPQCLSSLPHPFPESALWLFLTAQIPSPSQSRSLSLHLQSRSLRVPQFAFDSISALPISAHPMTQLVSGIMALQLQSQFRQAFDSGLAVRELWRPALQDCLDLIAQLTVLAAFIYRRVYKDGQIIEPDPSLDHAANFCHMMGHDDSKLYEVMRMYLLIHSDHEGGAVTAHTTRLVGSTLADPYRAFAAGLNGCAGPLHGLAIQESFRWMNKVVTELGEDATPEQIEDFVRRTLNAGKIIPGFGHAMLKKADPRYSCLFEFCERNFSHDPKFQTLAKLGEIVPRVMQQQGKVRNPLPNADAIIGVIFNHFGLGDEQFFCVFLGVARSIGALSQLVWDRALCLPLERPSCLTLDWIEDHCAKKPEEGHNSFSEEAKKREDDGKL